MRCEKIANIAKQSDLGKKDVNPWQDPNQMEFVPAIKIKGDINVTVIPYDYRVTAFSGHHGESGKAGDYLVQEAGSLTLVSKDEFEKDHRLVDSDYGNEVASLREVIESRDKEIAALKDVDTDDTIELMNDHLDAADETIARRDKELATRQGQFDAMDNEVASLRKEIKRNIETATEQITDKDKKIQALRDELDAGDVPPVVGAVAEGATAPVKPDKKKGKK